MVSVAPYWNVNYIQEKLKFYLTSVSVAPYWNVNVKIIIKRGCLNMGISSSILECKFIKTKLMGI